MGIQVRTTVILAAALTIVTPSAFAQISITRAPRPAMTAPIAPPLATPEQAFDRLPEAEQQALVSLAAQETLHDMELSQASTQALSLLAANDGGDIETLVTIVLMLAARDADNDIRQVMAEMSATEGCSHESDAVATSAMPADGAQTGASMNVASFPPARLNLNSDAIRPPPLSTSAAIRANETVEQAPTSLCEPQGLRLQMLMDRRAKAYEMLSRMLQRQSATEAQIISNIK